MVLKMINDNSQIANITDNVNKPLISIVTVCFNSAKTIRCTIESVLNQTYTNIEYLIIDGKSTDNTLDIIKEYEVKFAEKGIVYRYISEPDGGIYDAINKGIKMATGEWVGIINSDDWYELDICCTINNIVDSNDEIIGGLVRFWNGEELYTIRQNSFNLIFDETLMHPGVFVKKNIYDLIGVFDTKYKIAADYDFFIRSKLFKCRYKLIDNVAANFSMGGISSSNQYGTYREIFELKLKYKIISKLKYIMCNIKIYLQHKI